MRNPSRPGPGPGGGPSGGSDEPGRPASVAPQPVESGPAA